MIATSMVVTFGMINLHTYATDPVLFSETGAYMALVMGTPMAIITMVFMLNMSEKWAINTVILIGSAIVFAGAP